MEQFERDFLFHRIKNRYIKYKNLKIDYPSTEVLYDAQSLYLETIQKAKENGLMFEGEIFDFMIKRGLWSEEEEKEMSEILPKHIEYFKVEIFSKWTNVKEVGRIRVYLDTAKAGLQKLYSKKHFFDYLSGHGVASYAKWLYIVENSVFRGDRLYDWSSISTTEVMSHINKVTISEDDIRDLARNDPWASAWICSKKGNMPIFSLPSSELSDEQKKLVQYSVMYDNIREYDDCPSEDIINDDDALDGWLILKRKEKDSEKKNVSKKTVKNSMNAQEVFIVVSDDDPAALYTKADVSKIYDRNDPVTRNIVKNRIDMIQKSGKDLKDSDFSDVKKELSMQALNLQRKSR